MDMGLLTLAKAAGVSRQTARTCVAKGLLPAPPYRLEDLVGLRVAAACLDFRPPAATARQLALRDDQAISLARGFLSRRSHEAEAVLMMSARRAVLALAPEDLAPLLAELGPSPVLVIPVGAWAAGAIHSTSTPRERPNL